MRTQTKLSWCKTVIPAAKEAAKEQRDFIAISSETWGTNYPNDVLDGFEAGYSQGFLAACRWLKLHGVTFAE